MHSEISQKARFRLFTLHYDKFIYNWKLVVNSGNQLSIFFLVKQLNAAALFDPQVFARPVGGLETVISAVLIMTN